MKGIPLLATMSDAEWFPLISYKPPRGEGRPGVAVKTLKYRR